tara:strand:- start:361 stop:567 length:207 start_codon:yes stop_codon:yes gene_type:complete
MNFLLKISIKICMKTQNDVDYVSIDTLSYNRSLLIKLTQRCSLVHGREQINSLPGPFFPSNDGYLFAM